jgi:hypothetical protein
MPREHVVAIDASDSTTTEDALNIFAIDNSGSTRGNIEYWDKVSKLLKADKSNNTLCVFWNSVKELKTVDKAGAINIAKSRYGTGCTDPSTFIPVLNQTLENNELPINLILITDGQIAPRGNIDKDEIIACIATCDEQLKEKKAEFSKVFVYFIDTGGPIDKSVAASFLRRADNYEYQYPLKLTGEGIVLITKLESELLMQDFKSITKEELEPIIKEKFKLIAKQESKLVENLEFELLSSLESELIAKLKPELISKFGIIIKQGFERIIKQGFMLITKQGSRLDLSIYYDDPQKFLDNATTIVKQIEDQGLGSKNQDIIDGLTKLRQNLWIPIQKKEFKVNAPLFEEIKFSLKEQGNERKALKKLDKIIKQENTSLKKKILEKIKTMIIAAESGFDLSLNKSAANRIRRAEKEIDETEENIHDINLDNFEFRSVNSEHERSELKIGKFVVRSKDVEQAIFDRIDINSQDYYLNHPLAILENKELRAWVMNFLVEIEVTNQSQSQESDENNYRALCKIFSGTSKLCIPLPYAVAILYFIIIEDSKCLKENSNYVPFVESLEKYMLNKLESEYVSVRNQFFKLPAALTLFFDARSTEKIETNYIFKILDILGYRYDEKARHQYAIKKNFNWMYNLYKKNSQGFEYWISSLTANELELLNGSKVLLDVNLSKEELDARRIPLPRKDLAKPYIELNSRERNDNNDDFVYSLSIREIKELRKIILENKNTSRKEILIPDEIPSANENINFYNYSSEENNKENVLKHKTQVCSTLYPFAEYNSKETSGKTSRVTSKKSAEAKFGPLADQIHLHKLFHDYVAIEQKFPSAMDKYCDFIKFLSKQQAKQDKHTLPAPIVAMIEEKLMPSYLAAVKEFLDSSQQSIDTLVDRVVIEETRLFLIENVKEARKHFMEDESQKAKQIFMNVFAGKEEAKVLLDKEEKARNYFLILLEKAKKIYEEKKDFFTLDDFPVKLFILISKTNRHISNREFLQKLALPSQAVCNSVNNQQEDDSHNSAQKNEEKTLATAGGLFQGIKRRLPFLNLFSTSNQEGDSHNSAQSSSFQSFRK